MKDKARHKSGKRKKRSGAGQGSKGNESTAAIKSVPADVESGVLHGTDYMATAASPASLVKLAEPGRETVDIAGVIGAASQPNAATAIHPASSGNSGPQPDAAPAKPVALDPSASIRDFEVLARNMGLLLEQGGKLAGAWFAPQGNRRAPTADDYAGLVGPLGRVADHWFADPARLAQAQTAFSSRFLGLWADTLKRLSGGTPSETDDAPEKGGDRRFTDPEWRNNPFFDFVRRAYLIGTEWAQDMVEGADSLDEPTRHRARFVMRQIASALSPTNFVVTNPELLRGTLAENGANLVRGAKALAEDLAAGEGDLRIRQTDESRFELGRNVAVTPGKVVFRNDLIELLQYAPQTEAVLKRPLLIVPPWINKFYILDLNPEKTFIGWAVAQGLTVFVVSWVNPDARHAAKGWDAYMVEGVTAALAAVTAATGEADVASLGYCVGGTLLAAVLAHMAAKGDRRVSSATFLTTQVDFTHAGDLSLFADAAQIAAVEAEMAETGYLKAAKMAQAFNMLRPDDLIWSYVVSNYLKGRPPLPFDLLAWNADATRMAAANHSFYLRQCYLENTLATGRMVLGGEVLDLGRVTMPIYNLAAREDHIAPALSVFDGSRHFGGPVRTVVAGSGHIAGVVNPPARAKYGYWCGPAATGAFDDWLKAATLTPGSWWPDWFEWLRAQAPGTVPARQPGDGGLETLDDAPGTYVRVRG